MYTEFVPGIYTTNDAKVIDDAMERVGKQLAEANDKLDRISVVLKLNSQISDAYRMQRIREIIETTTV